MICPACGKMNEDGFRFCVKCGSNLDDPSEVTYESVDMGGYHTEEEFAQGHHSGFTMGSGVFCISDRPASDSTSEVYTSDELNDTEEEFDFSMFDEPDTSGFGTLGSAPLPPPKTIDNSLADEDDDDIAPGEQFTSRAPAPRQNPFQQPVNNNNAMQRQQPPMQQGFGQMHQQMQPQQPYPGAFGQQQMPQRMNQGYGQQSGGFGAGAPQYPQQNRQNQPQQFGTSMPPQGYGNQPQNMMYGQPQIIGYEQSGAPIYGQPGQQMMYGQPQIIGYDQSGQPVYGQPGQQMMYAQPQIIGYDQKGQPIYGQPVFMQPQIIGYEQNGSPIYGQPPMASPTEKNSGMMHQGMMSSPMQQQSNGLPSLSPVEPEKPKKEEKADFWDFFDDGKKDPRHEKPAADDFFGKSSHSSDGMGDLSTDGLDFSKLRRAEKKKRDYMGDTPLVDAADLNPNEAAKFNRLYMKATEQVNADDLEAHSTAHSQDKMGITSQVDVSRLSQNIHMKSRISMGGTDSVDASDLQAYVPEHRTSIMGEADHAVEALPKKKNPYQSELDLIELPEYMKAKKTAREDNIEIPSLPKV